MTVFYNPTYNRYEPFHEIVISDWEKDKNFTLDFFPAQIALVNEELWVYGILNGYSNVTKIKDGESPLAFVRFYKEPYKLFNEERKPGKLELAFYSHFEEKKNLNASPGYAPHLTLSVNSVFASQVIAGQEKSMDSMVQVYSGPFEGKGLPPLPDVKAGNSKGSGGGSGSGFKRTSPAEVLEARSKFVINALKPMAPNSSQDDVTSLTDAAVVLRTMREENDIIAGELMELIGLILSGTR